MKRHSQGASRTVAFLVYDGFTALDLTGPMDAFCAADAELRWSIGKAYTLQLVGEGRGCVTAESGLRVYPDVMLRNLQTVDTLFVPGGGGLRNPARLKRLVPQLRRISGSSRRVVSVCTGIYALAEAGLLDDRSVTTHWRFAGDVAQRFPRLRVNSDTLFIRDGKFYTSGGVTAGIDLTLALIEEDHGAALALTVARELVMYLRRAGGQHQFSDPLKIQIEGKEPFGDLLPWISGNLAKDLSVETLARRVGLCARHFTRRFRRAHGTSPAAFVENLRLAEAREQLTHSRLSIDRIARMVGFRSSDAFRRCFRDKLGVSPTQYRQRFAIR